jgi:hypothetical protein
MRWLTSARASLRPAIGHDPHLAEQAFAGDLIHLSLSRLGHSLTSSDFLT